MRPICALGKINSRIEPARAPAVKSIGCRPNVGWRRAPGPVSESPQGMNPLTRECAARGPEFMKRNLANR